MAGFIQNAWKPGTKAQYAAVWRQWTAWCGRQSFYAATPSAVNLLNYLWYLYSERQLAWRTLGVHRSAVATLLQPYAPETLGEDRRISRFMRSTFYSHPPPRKLKTICDVAAVLKYIKTWGDIEHLSRTRLDV